jgi:hypothetical protein
LLDHHHHLLQELELLVLVEELNGLLAGVVQDFILLRHLPPGKVVDPVDHMLAVDLVDLQIMLVLMVFLQLAVVAVDQAET